MAPITLARRALNSNTDLQSISPVTFLAIAAERRIQGWSRAKKKALMNGDFQRISEQARRRKAFNLMVRDASLRDAPHHEV
jgi:hypothetical protein